MATSSKSVKSPRVVNIEDLRNLARRRLPKMVFDYLDGGADAEVTLRENCRAFESVTFRPRQAVSVPACDLRTRVLGIDVSFPALLAPVGYSRLMHPGGEVAAARAAGAAGTAYILSTISGHRLEDVKAGSSGAVCYQLYLLGDSLFAKIPFLPQILGRPGWLMDFLLDGGLPQLPNVVIPGQGVMPLQDVSTSLARGAVTWEDLKWIRNCWPGPIVIKGVLTGDDARRAVDEGAVAVVVSNHGGRQLDGVPATLRVLPEIASAVNGQAEVLMDGGIRRGSDIVKAICLGARAVLIGRAYAYGLAAAGEAGVARALEILRADVERTLRLLGCPSIGGLDRSFVDAPAPGR